MRKLTGLLHEAGDWHRRHSDFCGFTDTNILYRICKEGHVQHALPGHRILCPDQPYRLRLVDVAIARLPLAQQGCVQAKFFSPVQENGVFMTNRQMANALGMSKAAFEKGVWRGKRQLAAILTTMGVDMS